MINNLLFALVVIMPQDTLPKDTVSAWMPLNSTPVLGKFHTQEALSFLERLVGLGESLSPGVVAERVRRRDRPDKYWLEYTKNRVLVSLGCAAVTFSPSSGRVINFGFGQLLSHDDRKENVSVDECIRRAQIFYKLAGGKYDLIPKEPFFYGRQTKDYMNLSFEQAIPGEEYPIGGPIECIFDGTNGLPEYFYMSYPPNYERAKKVAAKFEAEEAAANAAMQVTGWERVQVGAQGPRYTIPSYVGMPNAMSERHNRLLRERKACLTIETSVNDAASWNPEARHYDRFVQVYVDAETGQAIAVLPAYLMQGGGSPRKQPVAIEDLNWLCGKVKGTLKRVNGTAPKSGKPVSFRTEKGAWLLAKYDAKSNHVFYNQDGKTVVIEPDKALTKALRTYRPSPFSVQPKMVAPEPKSKTVPESKK